MNKCDNCVKDIDTCNVCTYNLEKTYKRQASNIGDYSLLAEEDDEYLYNNQEYDED